MECRISVCTVYDKYVRSLPCHPRRFAMRVHEQMRSMSHIMLSLMHTANVKHGRDSPKSMNTQALMTMWCRLFPNQRSYQNVSHSANRPRG
jgi:hypothetical protein